MCILDPLGITPTELVANEGETVNIFCLLNPPNNFTYNDESLPANVIPYYNANAITITNVQGSNAGYYECTGKDIHGYTSRSRMKVIVSS